jgi:tRNA dimethylallyltransferase
MSTKAIILAGPTASGKTAVALKLATLYPIEIISVDSALIYQDMNIGTAKPSATELAITPHHLIDIRSPLESYSVAEFITDCDRLIREISLRGKIPLLVGGTMMYYNALLNGISRLPQSDLTIRQRLSEQIKEHGLNQLYQELTQVDAVAAAKIAQQDTQRIMRALEVYYISGQPLSQLQQQSHINLTADINFLQLAIIPSDRSYLHHQINERFELMLQAGLIDEVQMLQAKYPELTKAHTAMRSVGYLQVWQYLDSQVASSSAVSVDTRLESSAQISYADLVFKAKAATRQLAKRQLTWLRSMPGFIGLDVVVPDLSLPRHSDGLFNQVQTLINGWLR